MNKMFMFTFVFMFTKKVRSFFVAHSSSHQLKKEKYNMTMLLV
jgi:hypothetical protein